MKINFILPAIGTSGGMQVIYKYAELLNSKGHDVVIYKGILSSNTRRHKIRVLNLINQLYCAFKSVFLLNKKHSNFDRYVWTINNKNVRNADFTIATAWYTAYLVNKLNSKKGKKIYFIQGFEIWDNKEYGLNSYKLPLRKIVISSWINDKLNSSLGLGPFPIVNNGINPIDDVNIKKNTIENGRAVNCLMLNHKLEEKGVRYGLMAFDRAKKEYPNLKLTMFGLDDKGNLPENIEYFQNPSQLQLEKIYDDTNIFIFPSISEGWGLTPIEAMQHKCAVVASKIGFVLDIGINKKNMLISNPRDYITMSNNILSLVYDERLLSEISNNGFHDVAKLNWNESANKLEEILICFAWEGK